MLRSGTKERCDLVVLHFRAAGRILTAAGWESGEIRTASKRLFKGAAKTQRLRMALVGTDAGQVSRVLMAPDSTECGEVNRPLTVPMGTCTQSGQEMGGCCGWRSEYVSSEFWAGGTTRQPEGAHFQEAAIAEEGIR